MHRTIRYHGTAIAVLLAVALLGSGLAAPCFAAGSSTKSSSGASAQQPIDINKASTEELTTIPGIGKTLAQRIVEFRDEHGPFGTVENLIDVPGIGPATLDNLRPHICTE